MFKILLYFLILIIFFIIIIYNYFTFVCSSKFGIETPGVKRKDKRVALCISGQIRNDWEITLCSIKKYIIDVLDADVFFNFTPVENTKIQNNILELLKPKRYVFENINTNSYINGYSKNYQIMMSRLINCNELKKQEEISNDCKYDIVIRIRPDLLMKSSIPNSIIDSDMANKLYYHEFLYYPLSANYGISDQYFLTDSTTMDKLLVPDIIHYRTKKCLYSEYLLYNYCNSIGIKLHIFHSPTLLYKFIDSDINSLYNYYFKDKGYTHFKFVCDIMNKIS